MSKAKNLTGRRYGRLVALRQIKKETDKKHAFWECQCDCGNKAIVRKDSLENGNSKSCGCILLERGYQKHGYSHTKLYSILYGMKERCYNPNHHAYASYGGRGIEICKEWLDDTESFIKWAYDNGYKEDLTKNKLSIDRIDVNGNYEPSNCRWVDKDVQNYNKRCTRKIFINGKEKTLLDLHNEYGIPIKTLRSRYAKYKKGLCDIEYLTHIGKIKKRSNQIIINVNGEKHNLTEWEKITGVSRKTIINRYKKGVTSYDDLFKKSR